MGCLRNQTGVVSPGALSTFDPPISQAVCLARRLATAFEICGLTSCPVLNRCRQNRFSGLQCLRGCGISKEMTRISIILISVSFLLAASCARYPAEETKYFFSHHFSKKVKKEKKAHYYEVLGKKDQENATQQPQGAPGKKFFQADDL